MNILLVEDNKSEAFLLKEIFSKNENAAVHWVIDGYDALDFVFRRKQYAAAERPDVILLDLKLPRISGYEVLKEIKSHPPYADIPIVIITTSLNPLDHTQCKALGADICMSKPYGLKDYEDMVQRLMSWASLRVNDNEPSPGSRPLSA